MALIAGFKDGPDSRCDDKILHPIGSAFNVHGSIGPAPS